MRKLTARAHDMTARYPEVGAELTTALGYLTLCIKRQIKDPSNCSFCNAAVTHPHAFALQKRLISLLADTMQHSSNNLQHSAQLVKLSEPRRHTHITNNGNKKTKKQTGWKKVRLQPPRARRRTRQGPNKYSQKKSRKKSQEQ